MIKDVRYKFEDFLLIEHNDGLALEIVNQNYNHERHHLFTIMLNFGYVGFESGVFSITAKDIYNFWNYAKDSVLKDSTLEEYYALFNFEKLYRERIPSIKTESSFHAKDFRMTVVWIKNDSNMVSSPIAYEQKGLKLKELEYGDTLGTLYPEYFDLYYKIDRANSEWKDWGNKEKYAFLEELELHSKKREFVIPINLSELLNKHKNDADE